MSRSGLTTLRVLIVDDERLAVARMRQLLEVHPDVEIVGEATGARDARALFQTTPADVVFLDIEMPQESGLSLAAELEVPFVFVTAHDRFAVEAFELRAVDYLLKPVAPRRLAATLGRVRALQAGREAASSPEALLAVRSGKTVRLVPHGQVAWIEANRDYSEVITRGAERLWSDDALAHWARRLDPDAFVQLRRDVLIACDAIERLERAGGGWVAVPTVGRSTFRIGRAYLADVKRRFHLD